jgi:hypothetical protein
MKESVFRMRDPQQPGEGHIKSQRTVKHKLLTALGALLLIGVTSSCATDTGSDSTDAASSDSATNASKKPAAKKPAAAKPALKVSAKQLIAVLEGNALKAKNTYKGKRVIANGFVGDIDASGKYFSLDPTRDAFILTGVQVQLDKKFQDQVSNFSKGQAVTVTGKITDVGEVLGYELEAETIK